MDLEKIKLIISSGNYDNSQWFTFPPLTQGGFTYVFIKNITVRLLRIEGVPEGIVPAYKDLTKPKDGWLDIHEGTPCRECGGLGIIKFRNNFHEYKFNCMSCGWKDCGDTVEIAGETYEAEDLRPFRNLPGCQIAYTKGANSAWIRFDGGDGFVTPRETMRQLEQEWRVANAALTDEPDDEPDDSKVANKAGTKAAKRPKDLPKGKAKRG